MVSGNIEKAGCRSAAKAEINFATPLIVSLAFCSCLLAQNHTTVRHYKERVDDTPPEIAQAEDAIQKNDFTSAEALLKKVSTKIPTISSAGPIRHGSISDSFSIVSIAATNLSRRIANRLPRSLMFLNRISISV